MKKRNAFTMIEAVISIVLFGIIATIGANIISRMYMNYIQARVVNYLQTQSEITLEQIAKRLQYRIKNSIVARDPGTDAFVELSNEAVTDKFDIIQWIGYSNEAMLLTDEEAVGWSGFVDLDASSKAANELSTPGSMLGSAADIMSVLSYDTVDLSINNPAALIFKYPPVTIEGGAGNGYGWNNGNINAAYILPIYMDSDTKLKIKAVAGEFPYTIYEHYYLAHTAYAIKYNAEGGSATDFKLQLVYNYQPWNGVTYNANAAKTATLAENVNLFRIKQTGTSLRLKLCLHDKKRSGFDRNVVACKEEVVL